MLNKKAFTFVEILVCLAIFSVIIGVVITVMNSGATNVHKGSFNALAANQALWIVTVMRNDIEKSVGDIYFESSDNTWNGDKELKVPIEGGVANYSLEKNGDRIKFVRRFVPSSTGSGHALNSTERRVQSFGDEYMTKMTVTRKNDQGIDYYYLSLTMEDSNKSAGGKHDFEWTASIYPPKVNEMINYWVPTVEK